MTDSLSIISREDAKVKGLKRFFTGEPCIYGHIAEREVRKNRCVKCRQESSKRYKARQRIDNPDKVREWQKLNYYNNKHLYIQHATLRRIRKRTSIPKWVNKSHILLINKFYKECPIGLEVDHIVPIAGVNVCGLHIVWNLQYLSPGENRKKRNKFPYGKESTKLAFPSLD